MGKATLHDERESVSAPTVDGPQQMPTAILKQERDVQVVKVYGEIDLACVGALDEVLDRAIDKCSGVGGNHYRIGRDAVVDLRAAWFMDVRGLRSLIGHQYALRAMDGGLLLVCPEGQIYRLLQITGVADMFAIYANLAEAIVVARGGSEGRGYSDGL